MVSSEVDQHLVHVMQPRYHYAEADYLAGVRHGTSRQWLSRPASVGTTVEQVTRPPYPSGQAPFAVVSFADLVEIAAIGGLNDLGFSMKTLRDLLQQCEQQLGVPHPLTALAFKTHGRDVFMDEGAHLPAVGKRKAKLAWTEILEPFLANLDYAHERVARWWPIGRAQPVVIDPDFGFGYPVVAASGVRTEIILERFQAGDLDEQIARDFNLEPVDVQRALQFELRRAA